MAWEVEFTQEFGFWWEGLSADEQESVDFGVRLLQERDLTSSDLTRIPCMARNIQT